MLKRFLILCPRHRIWHYGVIPFVSVLAVVLVACHCRDMSLPSSGSPPRQNGVVKPPPTDPAIARILKWGTSERWKYIVIHHSETDKGNADTFDDAHRRRGYTYGLAYHFVICNGTSGRKDGQIEVGARWKKQMDGAHCRGTGNKVGIGICLVGNFHKTKPTKKQLDSLLLMVNHLQAKYDIPVKNVKGHGEMPGAHTDCPGKNFRMKDFRKKLK